MKDLTYMQAVELSRKLNDLVDDNNIDIEFKVVVYDDDTITVEIVK